MHRKTPSITPSRLIYSAAHWLRRNRQKKRNALTRATPVARQRIDCRQLESRILYSTTVMPVELFDLVEIEAELEAPEYELLPSLGNDGAASSLSAPPSSNISQDLSRVLDELHSRDGNPEYLEKPKRRSKRQEAAGQDADLAELN